MSNSSETLLSTVQKYQKHNTLPINTTHPFAFSVDESFTQLQELIHTTDHLANVLSTYSSAPFSNPKLVSLLRQHASIIHTLHQSDHSINQIIDALRKRPSSSYGEDIPLDPTSIVGWCVSRLEAWGNSVGMETFKDDGREDGISIVLGGKVLVIDVDFSINRTDPLRPQIHVSSVKTSYAISNTTAGSTSNTSGSTSLDILLYDSIEKFCVSVQNPEEVRNLEEAARLGIDILEQLRYLVLLDRLAAGKDDGDLKWFTDVDELCSVLENFAKSEGEVIASSLSFVRTPLDIFLLRSHALPLPYLVSPSISFLVYMSPVSYLSLLKKTTPNLNSLQNDEKLPHLDVTFPSLRSYLHSDKKGVTIATLSLSAPSEMQLFSPSMSLPTFTARPTFPLAPQGSQLEHIFPQTANLAVTMSSNDLELNTGRYTWNLDFTNGGKHLGIVMSQSRMRDIELVINPLGGIDTLNSVGIMSFGAGSWVDLLLNPGSSISPERYTTLYISPTSVHPPLQLRLTVPDEPGFRLEKIPVHSMKEVWGVLEVVREQCWLNEILTSCPWTAEGITNSPEVVLERQEATEEELQAILSGDLTPTKIPVNVFLPSHPTVADTLFQAADLDSMSIPQIPTRRPKIVMISPERPPMSGLVEISVIYDETRPRGIAIEISGAMGSDIKLDVLEEISRRGGTLGLSGRVWSKAHSSM